VDGTVAWSWDPEPFGNTQPTGTLTYNHRFPGQYFDRETGLHHNGFRDYHPTTGRYIESDPLGLAAGLNTYAYVNSNPLRFIDPSGLETAVITVVSYFADHSAVRVDNAGDGSPALYNPGSSYVSPSVQNSADPEVKREVDNNIFYGPRGASLSDFIKFYTGNGNEVHV
jgi:RHS repeat-associated protein